jgi:hypothetical protein
MATSYTDVGTIQNAPHVGDAFLTSQRHKGKVRVVSAVITMAGQAAGELINICKLRKGDEVVGGVMLSAALGAGVTVAIGDTDTSGTARYLEATVCTSALRVEFPSIAKIAGVPYTITQDCWLQAVTAVGAATGAIKFTVLIAPVGA